MRRTPPSHGSPSHPPPVSIAREPIFEAMVKRLREDILRGVYPPKAALRLQELADRFGTSLMPVRESLHRLAAEGLVVTHPRKGASVAEFDAAEALEICQLRSMLMAHAARLATPRLTQPDIEELRSATEGIDTVLKEQPLRFEDYLELNERFHRLICERSGNRHLMKILRGYDALGRVAMYRFFQSPGDLGRFNSEHWEMLEAFAQRDAGQAEMLVARHMNRSVERIRSLMESAPQ